MSNKKLPILTEWNDDLALPPSFDEYQDKLQQEKDPLAQEKLTESSLSTENND